MAKGVFTYKPGSAYDDQPWERYHFPRTYLRTVEKIVGDYVIYYEPGRLDQSDRRGGKQAYTAIAKVACIVPDRNRADHYYAMIEAATYIEFTTPVPFHINGDFMERALRKGDGTVNKGQFGRAVRVLEEDEFDRIVRFGFATVLGEEELETAPQQEQFELAEIQRPFERPVIESLVRRPLRDRAFARRVLAAYGDRCAITGLLIRNGRRRPEVQAAHVQPVAYGGPDTVCNGLALTSTLHWMFDRGLITLDEDYRLVTSTAGDIAPELFQLVRPGKRVHLPSNKKDWPHPKFLEFHRQKIFLG